MNRVAVFVDAGYFWVQACHAVLGRQGKRDEISVDYAELRQHLLDAVAKQTQSAEVLRVYWYDGPGQSGKGPDHKSIDDLDDFKLRLGTRNTSGQQKAVDGLIIADILSLTQSRAITSAVLISGDADLTPGVTAAQAMGLRVHLVILEPKTATSPYLAAEADSKFSLPESWIREFVSRISPPSVIPLQTAVPQASTTVASPSGDAGSAAPNLPISIHQIAQNAYSSAANSALAPLLSSAAKGPAPLPPEIDKLLLFEARKASGSLLSEAQKRALRQAFKQLL